MHIQSKVNTHLPSTTRIRRCLLALPSALLLVLQLGTPADIQSQAFGFSAVRAGVCFDRPVRPWDGFGFNYVETAHTYDYEAFQQEYGGFSLLDESEKQEIVDLVFGAEGLKVGLVKMFLGPNHQKEAGGAFDHETTTSHMRYFVREGLKLTRQRGDDLQIITTLYGPPGFVTLQKKDHARDLDPAAKDQLALYMIDWVKFLKEKERLPVRYLSLHNEGEDWHRWTREGMPKLKKHDYNLFWPPDQVAEFLKLMPPLMKQHGLGEVGITPGEPSNWYRFSGWGISQLIAQDRDAVASMGLITSHGFYRGEYGHWFGEHNSLTNDRFREQRPELHSWVTSTSWALMDAAFIKQIHGNIYTSKVNAIIPWAGIQRPTHWVGGDPNPGSAITVREDGTYEVRKGYHFYKQVTRAGQPGMGVVETYAMNSEVAVIGFSGKGTRNPDAFVIINIADGNKRMAIEVQGCDQNRFSAWRTVDHEDLPAERYQKLGSFQLKDGVMDYTAPPGSVTTFFAGE